MLLCYTHRMTIAAYIRISSKSQKSDSQRQEIIKYLEAHGHDVNAVQWFEDTETGTTLSRSGLNALCEAVFAGTVKMVIVWKIDRLGRTLKDGINMISSLCENGVRVISVTQQIDLSGSVGRMVAAVLFGIAETELEHIRDRQAAGIAVAKSKGIYKGRKKGTTKAKPQRAKALRKQGLKIEEIATALNTSTRTVQRYLRHK